MFFVKKTVVAYEIQNISNETLKKRHSNEPSLKKHIIQEINLTLLTF